MSDNIAREPRSGCVADNKLGGVSNWRSTPAMLARITAKERRFRKLGSLVPEAVALDLVEFFLI
jgi:hypothetical protein